jgi:hypothetical protein
MLAYFPEVLNHIAGDWLLRDIRSWLCPPDPWETHNFARASSYHGTGAWFINGNIFAEWKACGPSPLLWIHGKRQLPPTAYSSAEIDFPFESGVWKECDLVRQPASIFVLRAHGVVQFHNHRGAQGNAKIWARITGHILS